MDTALREMLAKALVGQKGATGALLAYLAGRDGQPEATAAIADADLTAVDATKLTRSPSATSASRALNTTFTVSATSPALVIYTVQIGVNASNASVQLLIGTDSPPTTVAGEAYLESLVLLGVAQIAATGRQQLIGFVPAGQHVLLSSSGAGTATLVNALELVF